MSAPGKIIKLAEHNYLQIKVPMFLDEKATKELDALVVLMNKREENVPPGMRATKWDRKNVLALAPYYALPEMLTIWKASVERMKPVDAANPEALESNTTTEAATTA